jgi:cell volume regulation protein A
VLATFPVIDGVPGSLEFLNIAFFAVLISTLVQGATFEPLARWAGATTDEPALPSPLVEVATIRDLGADVVEVPVSEGDAAVGVRVGDLGLPREALINILVRDGQALPPHGSMRLEAGDRVHIIVRQAALEAVGDVRERWRTGPVGPAPRPPRVPATRTPIFTTRPWLAGDGDAGSPDELLGLAVVERVASRWDVPGALVVLADGRYAVSGPQLLVGSRHQLQWHARRRLRVARTDPERAWWQEVIGAAAL